MVKVLLDFGADWKWKNAAGQPASHYCSEEYIRSDFYRLLGSLDGILRERATAMYAHYHPEGDAMMKAEEEAAAAKAEEERIAAEKTEHHDLSFCLIFQESFSRILK